MSLREYIKQHTPWQIRLLSRRIRLLRAHKWDKRRSAKEVFTEIYERNLWGDGKPCADREFPFNSGPGSGEANARPYVENVRKFIETHNIRTVVDLGCGDFRVGSGIARGEINYIGVDIVQSLIDANQRKYGNSRIQFQCRDIINDALPTGDLCLVREVFQHLSNSQIAIILKKLEAFKWVIVTERLPSQPGTFKPNVDKPHGSGIRLLWQSGVLLSAPPFGLSNVTPLFEVTPENAERKEELLSSVLLTN